MFKAEIELALEPKAYGVLLTLLAQPHVAIERDHLLDTVWGHRHVTPAVLNRVIALLRRALGDNAEHPRLMDDAVLAGELAQALQVAGGGRHAAHVAAHRLDDDRRQLAVPFVVAAALTQLAHRL